jgi:hypothetical protein
VPNYARRLARACFWVGRAGPRSVTSNGSAKSGASLSAVVAVPKTEPCISRAVAKWEAVPLTRHRLRPLALGKLLIRMAINCDRTVINMSSYSFEACQRIF